MSFSSDFIILQCKNIMLQRKKETNKRDTAK